MSDKVKRRPNFSAKEMEVLIESVRDFEELIVAKHRNASTNEKKTKAWNTIARKVSAVGVAMRSEEECRKKFGNLQSSTKAKAAKIAKNKKTTGGGPPSQPLTATEEHILETLAQESVLGIAGGFDTSDALYEAACCSSNASPPREQTVSATVQEPAGKKTFFEPTNSSIALATVVEVAPPAISNQSRVAAPSPNERGRDHRVNCDALNMSDHVDEAMDLQRKQVVLLEEIKDLLVFLTDRLCK